MNSMRNALVSVIIRSMDRETLQQSLDSIAAQTYDQIEVVIINARGKEHRDLGTRCGRFPLRQINPGIPLARSRAANLGMREAHGDYLIFLDDDDWFLPHHIKELEETLATNTSVGAAYAAVECVSSNENNASGQRIHVFNQPFDRTRLLIENYIPIHAIMFRRSLLESGCCFDENLDTYEDWDFWIQLSRLTDFAHIDAIGAVYCIAPGSGFGITAAQHKIETALKLFFGKWRKRWSEEELLAIATYAKYRSMYFEIKEILEDKGQEIAKYLEEITRSSKLLEDKTREIVALSNALDTMNVDVTRLLGRVADIEGSTSWRITAPLRAMMTILRQFRHQTKVYLLTTRQYFQLAMQIGRSDGLGVLLSRVKRKLARLNPQQFDKPMVYHLEKRCHTLSFTPLISSNNPTASIIIPVHNKHLYTFSCLKSIHKAATAISYEIIVVDDHSDAETSQMLSLVSGIKCLRNENEQGFIPACNLGAAHAESDYLIFLNNDTLVTDNWLDRLLDSFSRFPEAGLIGAKLIYPDGRLQEAGGIVWRDGTTWNYGRDDIANKPQYNYLREVDYCSGACIAIPRMLFERVGAFSTEFSPAYFEDVDLAFKVKAIGKKVFYQPAATIVHFEGVSLGRSTWSGMKGHQVINRKLFFDKWRHKLVTHRVNGSAAHLEKDRGAWKRMLVVDVVMVTPDHDSGSLRMFKLLEELVRLGVKVTFAALHLDDREPYKGKLQQIGVEVIYTPYFHTVRQYLEQHGMDLDAVLLSRVYAAEQLIDEVRCLAQDALLLFDTVDLHFLREMRMAKLHNNQAMAKAAEKRKQSELGLMRKADITLVVSDYEKQLLESELPGVAIEVVSNIHDLHGCATGYDEREGLIFIGGFNHPPNVDAVIYFVHEILPLVNAELGPVKTYIVGSNPPEKVKKLASENVIVTGYVEDVSNLFAKARLSIAPLRYGAGVKGKINMSMAYGVPVVATPLAIEGMHLVDGVDVVLGENVETFAQGIVKVYRDKLLWEALSANGMVNIEQHFSRRVARETLLNILNRASRR